MAIFVAHCDCASERRLQIGRDPSGFEGLIERDAHNAIGLVFKEMAEANCGQKRKTT